METNQNGFEDILTKLALIVDGAQAIFPKSKSVLIYEVDYADFNYIKGNLKNTKIDENQIKIDISGTEIIFILENSYKFEDEVVDEVVEEVVEKVEEPKKGFFKRLFNL
jgi:hypothetical protein